MIEWKIDKVACGYEEAMHTMEQRVQAISTGQAPELVWFLEHPPLYTCGSSGDPAQEILKGVSLPVYHTGRGGRVTYHGPGQRIIYALIHLKKRHNDLRRYVSDLENWIILALKDFGIDACRREGRIGVWVPRKDGRDDKIAAIGVRVRRGITMHGFALNINPDLSYYKYIIPCGILEHGITSMHQLGVEASREEVDKALRTHGAFLFK